MQTRSNMKFWWMIFMIFLGIVLALIMASKAGAQEPPPQDNVIFIPFVESASPPVIYRLDTRLTLYEEGKHFVKSGNVHTFTSSTYYGYFSKANWIQSIEPVGPKMVRVVSFTCPLADEQAMLDPYRGDQIFVQRLSSTVKITIYR